MEATAKYRPNIEITSDAKALASRAADLFVSTAREALSSRGAFYVALSGGRTPKLMFETLAVHPATQAMLWQHVHVF